MRSKIWFALILVAALSSATPSSAAEHLGRCTIVPWTDAAAPTITVRINGEGPFTFVVDTGAEGDAWIKPEVAGRLHMRVVGNVPPDGPDDPEQDLRLFQGTSIQLGAVTFVEPQFAEMLQMGPKPQPFDGIIGSGLWSKMQMAFDYKNRQLLLTETNLEAGAAVTFDRGMPVLPLSIGGHRVLAHLDTGNIAGKLFVEEAAAKNLPLGGAAVLKWKVRTHYGEQSIMEAPLADQVVFNGGALPVDTVRWPPAIGLPNLGSRGLTDMLVRIDPRSRKVDIRPAGAPLSCG